MSTLYFASTKEGYVQRFIEGKPPNTSGRQIPVHVRVNQFMHNKPNEEEKNIRKEVEKETEHHQYQNSARSQNIEMPKGINSTLVKSAHLMQKRQQSLNNDESMTSSLIKQRQCSSRHTSTSQIDKNNSKKLKVSIIQSEIGKNQDYYDIFDRKQLEKQIEKQKLLRKNLESSYLNLVQKMIVDKKIEKRTDYQQQTLTERKKRSKVHPIISAQSTQIKDNRFKSQQKERRQSQSSQKSNRSQDVCHKHESKQIEKAIYDTYEQHLNLQKQFQSNLIQEIRKAHARIDALENILVKRQIQLEKLLRERATYKPNIEKQTCQKQISSQSNQAKQIIRHQFHYIFTIFVMFLIIVVVSRSRDI